MNRLYETEKYLVSSILSASFLNNKSVLYIIKKGKHSDKYIKSLMNYAYHEGKKQGGILLSNENNGVALFTYPQRKTSLTSKSMIESIKLVFNVFGVTGIKKVLNREKYIKMLHPKSDFLYLWFIGVVPDMQKKGTGSLLLNKVLSIAEKQNVPVYLETSTVENLPFYKKHGFEIYHEWPDDQSGILLYFLRR